jgi:hypothetical protein
MEIGSLAGRKEVHWKREGRKVGKKEREEG